jgi:putative addiction module component (TIGR02574 family)
MSLVNFKSYTKSQKIKLMEELWEDLNADENLESPKWHQTILDERLEQYHKGELKTYSLDEIKHRLNSRFDS